jgi:hypothetical protein
MLVKRLTAKEVKVFEKAVTGLFCSSLYISKHTAPVTRAVVVAMAGVIFPAMPRAVCRSASGIR